MNVLVTGATGFIGSCLVERLKEEGCNVYALVRDPSVGGRLDGVERRYGDVGDSASVAGAAKGMDIVYHCAAVSGHNVSPDEYNRTNVEGTKNILESCVKHGVKRFIYTSTILVAHPHGGRSIDESTSYRNKGASAYADSKIDAEKLVLECSRKEGLPVSIVRLGIVYGPGETWVVRELGFLLKTGQMLLSGTGGNPANVVYVDNAVDALVLMRSDGQSACEIYNLACDHEMTVRAFLFSIADAMGWKRPAFFLPYAAARKLRRVIRRFERLSGRSRVALLRRYGFQLFTQNLRFDNSRIKTLGYSPGVGHSEAVSRVAQWLRENDLATSISGKEGSG